MSLSLKNLLRSPLLPLWLIVALLPFGRSAELGTLVCVLALAVAGWRMGRDAFRSAGSGWLLALLACYIGAAFVSSFAAIAPVKSWETVLALLRYVPLGLYACLAIRGRQQASRLYVAVAAVIAFWVLDAWMQMLTGWSLRGHAEPERISGLFGADDPKLGPSLAVLSPIALWSARSRWGRGGLLLAFLLILGPVMLSGSRAAWVCFGLVTLAFIGREAHSLSRFLAICAAAAVLACAAAGVAWKVSTRFDARMQRTLMVLGGNEQAVNEAMTGRLDIWHVSVRMIEAHPLTGVGVRGFRYAYPHYASANDHFLVGENCGEGLGACHAHQLVLEILTETGVVGLMLWLTAVVIAWQAWRHAGKAGATLAFPLTVSLAAMLFPINAHLAFYSAWWGLLFAWLLSLWCAVLFAGAKE